jgi:hypothetical protein
MSIRAFVLAIVCISAAAVYVWPSAQQPASPTSESSALTVRTSPEAKDDTAGTRTYSSKHPLLVAGDSSLRDLPPAHTPAKPVAERAPAPKVAIKEDAAVRPVASEGSAKRISSTKPGDAEAREQLVRDIQYELKRAGCYEGEVQGAWNNATRQAMQTFTQRMNATLPVDQPDYVLLTLLQAQRPLSCKSGCPAGQLADGGRCVPRAIVAQQPGGSNLATSAQQTNQDLLPGRMSAGASAVGQDLPAAPQTQDGVASITDTRPHAERRQPPRSRSTSSAPKGSTRQVFNKMMLNAP